MIYTQVKLERTLPWKSRVLSLCNSLQSVLLQLWFPGITQFRFCWLNLSLFSKCHSFEALSNIRLTLWFWLLLFLSSLRDHCPSFLYVQCLKKHFDIFYLFFFFFGVSGEKENQVSINPSWLKVEVSSAPSKHLQNYTKLY